MTLRLKGASAASSSATFSWDEVQSPSPPPDDISSLPEPPTSWLPARDMKIFGAHPLSSTSTIGLIRCRDCNKPILRSVVSEHAASCTQIRNGKGSKGKAIAPVEGEDLSKKSSKKRKASPTPSDPNDPNQPPQKKPKTKPAPKVNKGRTKGPVDYDRQCGVINDKGLPCSRSLTCKSHAMGAKRSVLGRSRDYDDLLLDWQRAHNPNFVEPVKRESKKEKKEKKEREKAEKKKAMEEAAVRMGLDPSSAAGKKAGAAAAAAAGVLTASSGHKKSSKKAAAAAAAVRLAEGFGEDYDENFDDLDSEAEVDELVKSLRIAKAKGVIGQPLALPCDEGSWFVQRRERARCCTDLLFGALMNGNGGSAPGIGSMGLLGSMGSVGGGVSIGGGPLGVAARPSVGAGVGGGGGRLS